MPEPRIQYAKTSDGVNVAYWTMGEGRPLVFLPFLMLSQTSIELQQPVTRSFYERLSERRTLVRYDCRASGLSDRNVTDYSLEGLLADLEAVVARLGLESFDLFAPARSGLVAVAYAVRHPERVSHLILWCTAATSAALSRPPPMTNRDEALRTLREEDWELYMQTALLNTFGWSRAEEARWIAELIREATTPEALRGFDTALAGVDVTALLPQVRALTLVGHRREHPFLGLDAARALAAGISDAELFLVEGQSLMPWGEGEDAVLRAIDDSSAMKRGRQRPRPLRFAPSCSPTSSVTRR